jgi:regulator of nucleoside diphosphate kinase
MSEAKIGASPAPNSIVMSSTDFARLEVMACEEAGAIRARLLSKLELGKIISGDAMPANVATIGSVLRYRIGDGPLERRTLALPEVSRPNGQFINVLTPVGLALLGRLAGETFDVPLADGGSLTISLAAVEFQPEAEARRRSTPPDGDGPEAA